MKVIDRLMFSYLLHRHLSQCERAIRFDDIKKRTEQGAEGELRRESDPL